MSKRILHIITEHLSINSTFPQLYVQKRLFIKTKRLQVCVFVSVLFQNKKFIAQFCFATVSKVLLERNAIPTASGDNMLHKIGALKLSDIIIGCWGLLAPRVQFFSKQRHLSGSKRPINPRRLQQFGISTNWSGHYWQPFNRYLGGTLRDRSCQQTRLLLFVNRPYNSRPKLLWPIIYYYYFGADDTHAPGKWPSVVFSLGRTKQFVRGLEPGQMLQSARLGY